MIIKSISHKNSSVSSMRRLINYIFHSDKLKSIEKGVKPLVTKQFIRGYDKDTWASQFKLNDEKRTFNHARRTVLRHEIMSFSPKSIPYLSHNTLKTLGKAYLKKRSSNAMGVCGVHLEGNKNPHIHFIMSGVSIDGRSTRISKKQFMEFKNGFQEFQKEQFPELSDSIVNHLKKQKATSFLT